MFLVILRFPSTRTCEKIAHVEISSNSFVAKIEDRLHFGNTQINLVFLSARTISNFASLVEDRHRLGNTQINLVFLSARTIFVTLCNHILHIYLRML